MFEMAHRGSKGVGLGGTEALTSNASKAPENFMPQVEAI